MSFTLEFNRLPADIQKTIFGYAITESNTPMHTFVYIALVCKSWESQLNTWNFNRFPAVWMISQYFFKKVQQRQVPEHVNRTLDGRLLDPQSPNRRPFHYDFVRTHVPWYQPKESLKQSQGPALISKRCPSFLYRKLLSDPFPTTETIIWKGDVEESDIFEFIQFCPKLTSLTIIENTKLSSQFFVHIIPYTFELIKLDLTGCSYVHEFNFEAFLSAAVNLSEFSLSDCAGFSQLSLLQILTLPKLRILHLKNQIDPHTPFGKTYMQQAAAKKIQLFL